MEDTVVAKATVLVGTDAIAFVRVLLLLAGLRVAWMKTSPCIKMIQEYGVWNFQGNQGATWEEYVEAICYRFRGQQDPLEELMELKRGNLEEYIQDFDILWNKVEINEKQSLVIFLGGLELEIKNTVKMFKPKTLKHAYNLARLQANTLSYKKFSSSPKRYSPPIMPTQPQIHLPTPPNFTQTPMTTHNTTAKPNLAHWHNNPSNTTYRNPSKPTKSLKNQEFEERQLKGLCFWCDDKFIPGHRCRNKWLYSLSITEEEEDFTTKEPTGDEFQIRELSPHISLDALEDTMRLNTMKATGRLDRMTVSIMIDSRSTHNFRNAEMTLKLQLQLTAIKPMTVQIANGERMEPKGLPSFRPHDHRIPLKEEGDSVNLRPYRYSDLQKDTLEEMVKEMLRAKIIRTSNNLNHVGYLGHIISEQGVATDPYKIQAIVDWPMPTRWKQLRGFLGLTGYYKRFVKGYDNICKPLTQLLKKKAKGWNEAATEAFNRLKKVMTNAPILALPDFNKTFIVEIDASMMGVRAVLIQEGHPITFISKSLGPKQQVMLVYEREMLAIL
ncbi:uncharacterized protein LOC133699462 [Populus nigra]|uniref:uncharacterized protein LOC133699462 n=1 Tax=Populus nigra TaxID=3691 RepID=UPI002B2677F5|nr:uncharacterized protein LOC133699462 [Populus nigra]